MTHKQFPTQYIPERYIPEQDHVGIALKRWAKKFNKEWERFDNPDWVAEQQETKSRLEAERLRSIERLINHRYDYFEKEAKHGKNT